MEVLSRRALAVAAAALLAACTVEVDGAPCTAPGTATECPGGQACGNDRRCSARALACAASRCTPVADDLCLDAPGLASGVDRARSCSDVDPVCGAWVVDRCADRGLVCGKRSGGASCECPATTARDLVVAAGGALADAPPFATGAASPGACAYRTLSDALAGARALAALDPGAPVTITATGAVDGAAVTFSGARGERFPLRVASGVALGTDARARGGRYELLFDAGAATSVAVVLDPGAALRDLTIRNGDGDASNVGIALACPTSLPASSLAAVVVDARSDSGRRLGVGVQVGGCSADAIATEVRGAWTGTVVTQGGRFTATGGSLTANEAGLVVGGGSILLTGVRVADNAGRGIDATSAYVAVEGARIVGNGDTGIALRAPTGVVLRRNVVASNGATTSWTGGVSGTSRRGGGVVLSGDQAACSTFELAANRIHGNHGDQILLVGPTAAPWTLDRPECWDPGAVTANFIGCYDPTPAGAVSYRGIVAVDAGASALNQWWGPGGPGAADVAVIGSVPGTIPVTTNCAWGVTLDCSAEDWPQPP